MSELETWEREFYEAGGGDPFLFYVVYGNVDSSAALSRSSYRTEGVPEGLDIMAYGPDSAPEVPGSFLEGYLWDELQSTDPELARAIEAQHSCLVLRGEFEDPENLNYLRDTIGFTTWAIDNGGIAVFDPQMFKWWSASSWREKIFEPAAPVPRHHTMIQLSPEESEGRTWVHTRGMRKFGRPDLSVPHVAAQDMDAVVDLCNRFIEMQAFGSIIPEGQDIRMHALPDGWTCHHGGHLDDPDFNNVHVRIGAGDA